MGSFLISFLFGTAVGMNLLVSIAVRVLPDENQSSVETQPIHEEVEVPPPFVEQLPIEEVLAAETENQQTEDQTSTPTPELSPSDTPTPTVTLTNTPTPSPTKEPTATPTPTVTLTPTLIPTNTPTPSPTVVLTVSSLSLDELFNKYANEYHVDGQLLRKIAKCESNFNTNAVGPKGLYLGMFQFGDGSWQSIRKQMGQDPNPSLRTSAEESIKTAAYAISLGRASMWPSCSK